MVRLRGSGVPLRVFAGLVGAIVVFVALYVLLKPITVDYDSGLLGVSSVSCGDTFAVNHALGGTPRLKCGDAVTVHRIWGWSLAGAGVIVVLGTMFIRPGEGRLRVD